MTLIWWGMLALRDPPKVSFLLSSVNRGMAATAWTQSGHPHVTGSRILDISHRLFLSSMFLGEDSQGVPLPTLPNRWKGFSREGRANPGVVTRNCFVGGHSCREMRHQGFLGSMPAAAQWIHIQRLSHKGALLMYPCKQVSEMRNKV
jgi:hypothetical protein